MAYRTTTLPPLFTLRREMDRLFDDAFGRTAAAPATWTPATDVREETGAWRFDIELPGIAPEQVEVTLEKGVLTVRGEKVAERRAEGAESDAPSGKWHVAERVQGRFKRTFQLPQSVAEDRITASFAHGVLTVVVPKVEVPKARRIEVETKA